MCSPLQNCSPSHGNAPLSFSPRIDHSSPRRQDQFQDFLNGIYRHYEPDVNYLVLQGKIICSKVLLLNLLILTDDFFQDPENYFENNCQIKVESLDKTDDYPDDRPVTIRIKASAYSPLNNDQSYTIETRLEFENPIIAEYISTATFQISRNWEIFRLPARYDRETFKQSNMSNVYKILDVNVGEWRIFKTLSDKEYEKLGSTEANRKLKHRFRVIHDLYKASQSQGYIPMQEPPFATLDVRHHNGYLMTGMVEEYYAEGDLFDLLTNPIYGKISFIDRLQFCRDLTHHFTHLVALGIFHTDIKPDNIMVKRNAADKYTFYIGDYLDSPRFKKIFDVFKTALEKSCVTPSDVNFFHKFRYIPTANYMHTRDSYIICSSLEAIKMIFEESLVDRQKRVPEFQKHIETLMEVSEKHQVFALGNTAFQILCQSSPYPNQKDSMSYRGDRKNQLLPGSEAYLQQELLRLSPISLPVVKKISQFVFTMLRDNHEERPDLKTAYKTFKSLLSESTDLAKIPMTKRSRVLFQDHLVHERPSKLATG